MAANPTPDGPLGRLTDRESEILRKAGERVFSLSKRLAEQEKEADQLRAEARSARELLAESREVRQVLSDQIRSLQTALDREYEERSELRRLLASLHVQMQELLPLVTGLSKSVGSGPALAVDYDAQPSPSNGSRHVQNSLARRLFAAAGEVAGGASKRLR